MRLSTREWMAVGLLLLFGFLIIPRLWKNYEPFELTADYRIPYALSEDYWTYSRLTEQIAEREMIAVVGDSVVWGEYVSPDKTLSSYLSEKTGSETFVNAGLNGAHPLALNGLVENYAHKLRGRRVILHCNLLWMSTPERDLQVDDETPFNHPGLVPQFRRIPAYKAPSADRLSTAINRSVPLFSLVDHIRIRDFDGHDVHSWSLDHPYVNPFAEIERESLPVVEEMRHASVPWTTQGIQKQDWEWVDLDTSNQWWAWRKTLEHLRSHGNDVFVIVGPFNAHILEEPSRLRYEERRRDVEEWLKSAGIAHVVPDALPSDEYGDASHPLSAGYDRLARSIISSPDFKQWLGPQ